MRLAGGVRWASAGSAHDEEDADTVEIGVQLIIGVIFGAICAAIAQSKGRSAIGWFFVGFFTGLIGLIIILVLGNERERERVRSAERAERRRLREQLRQERMKSEAYRRHSAARLDQHDQALGMDTRGTTALPAGHGVQRQSLVSGPASGGAAVREWHYDMRGEARGPVSADAIRRGLAQGKIDGMTLVWREGMEEWQAISEVPMFRSSFQT
jgi:hypothetical protein